LFIIYAGLISLGAYYGSEIRVDTELSNDMQRAKVLRDISTASLGEFGNTVLSILISLACFTTAIGIVAGTADYFKGLLNNSQTVYVVTAILASALGVLVGQLDFNAIIVIAIPVLLFIYPITIVLILLNVLPEKFATPTVFKAVVIATFVFSIPDVVGFISPSEGLKTITESIPLSNQSLGWVLPAFVTFILVNTIEKFKRHSNS
jgi:LIVCS family branched-chain amino acid:cation transporter